MVEVGDKDLSLMFAKVQRAEGCVGYRRRSCKRAGRDVEADGL